MTESQRSMNIFLHFLFNMKNKYFGESGYFLFNKLFKFLKMFSKSHQVDVVSHMKAKEANNEA